jgi:hypothetical protein
LRNFLKSLISLTFDTALNRPALIAPAITAATQFDHRDTRNGSGAPF